MNRYGQAITWGTASAPQLFTGICTGYSYNDQVREQLDDDMVGEYRALIQEGRTAAVNFSARVTDGSVDFLDLSAGGAVAVTGISTGVVLATRAVERWELSRSKTISVEGIHFPSIVQADPVLAGVAGNAFTVSPQTALASLIFPGGNLIWGTNPITHAAGVLHMLQITQELQAEGDDVDPTGVILGATSHGYMRRIEANILSKAAAPAVGSVLAFTSGPDNSAGYRISAVETAFAEKRGKMYTIRGTWIPPFSS